jgi:hypothetical protein
MRSHELARLDPLKVPPDLHAKVLDRMTTFHQFDLALGFLEKIGYRPNLDAACEYLLLSLTRTWDGANSAIGQTHVGHRTDRLRRAAVPYAGCRVPPSLI